MPGLSGNEKACAHFLQERNVPIKKDGEWLCYYDLSAAQRKKLASELIAYGKENGLDEEILETMVGDVYLFLHEPEKSELRDALEFSTLLNACGRHEKAALGVRVCLHEQGAYEEAKTILAEHRRQIKADRKSVV